MYRSIIPGYGRPNLCYVGITKPSSDLRRTTPVIDFLLDIRIASFHDSCYHGMPFTISLKISNHLAYSATGIPFAKPGRDICVIIIQCFQFLNVHQNDRHIKTFNFRKHFIGRGICQMLHHDNIHFCGTEQIAGSLRLLFSGYHTSINNLHRIGKHLLERFVLLLKLRQ